MPEKARTTAPLDVALCTICDRTYLAHLLVMARSLRRACPGATLHVVCLDDSSRSHLEGRPGIVAVPLAELERGDAALESARRLRTQQRYAWTLKPVSCLHVLGVRTGADAVLFLDADLMFFGDPQPIFDELGSASVLLVPERHEPPDAWTGAGRRRELGSAEGSVWGFYNSGTIGFRRDPDGIAALRWWREQCLAFAEGEHASGHGGYQWQLNALPERFGGVRVMTHPGVGLAPWNTRGAELRQSGRELLAGGRPLIFYHYQSLRLRRSLGLARVARWRGNDLGTLPGVAPAMRVTIARHWRLPARVRTLLWEPYMRELAVAVAELLRVDPAWAGVVARDPPSEIRADVLSDLRWRAYRVAGRVLPRTVRGAASALRARLRERLTTPV